MRKVSLFVVFISFFCLLTGLFASGDASFLQEKPMVIVIPSYNNAKWCNLNVLSVLGQKYTNFRVIYIDDGSLDGTSEKVENLVLQSKTSSSEKIFQQFFSASTPQEKAFWAKSNLRMDKFIMPENGVTFRRVIFDDRFSGDISTVTAKFCEEVNREKAFFTLVSNVNRAGAMANHYRAAYSAQDEEIVVTIDGDDWLSDDLVLARLNAVYGASEVWMTHGNLMEYPHGQVGWCEPVPSKIIAANAFRTFKCPSHMRTYYSWIFKKIQLEDLVYQGKFLPMTCDMAIMYPIAEMAGERHAFISQVNYVYNMVTPINDNKVNAQLQRDLDKYIRGRKPYQRLER
jgi:glycosyltransferase involved in cell wall biosynthesis